MDIRFVPGTAYFTDFLTAFFSLFVPFGRIKGKALEKFENLLKSYLGVGNVFLFSSGRVGLNAILKALDIKDGDEVIIQAYTCVVVPNAIIYTGAKPVYVDIDFKNFSLDVQKLEETITQKTRAIVVQHTFGIPGNIDSILKIAKEHNLVVIEDCAQALGAEYKGKKVGVLGDAAFFSMEHSKIISTEMGGAVVTNNKDLADKIEKVFSHYEFPDVKTVKRLLRQFINYYVLSNPNLIFRGIAFFYRRIKRVVFYPSTTEAEIKGEKPEHYERRLANSLARIGINQLKRIQKFNNKRIGNAEAYSKKLLDRRMLLSLDTRDSKPIYLRFPIYVEDKIRFIEFMNKYNIQVGSWFEDVIHPKVENLDRFCYTKGSCPVAEEAANHIVNLPTHPMISRKKLLYIIETVNKYYKVNHEEYFEKYYEDEGEGMLVGGQYMNKSYGKGMNFYFNRRYLNTLEVLSGNLRDKKVLDVGSGVGVYTLHLLKEGADVLSLDISDSYLKKVDELCRLHNLTPKLIKGDVVNLDFEESSFDVVLLLDVLEHVVEYEIVLKNINRVLKEEGILVMSFPSKYSYKETRDRIASKRTGIELAHVNFFALKDVKELLKEMNFKIEDTKYSCYFFPFGNRILGKYKWLDNITVLIENMISLTPLKCFAWNIVMCLKNKK